MNETDIIRQIELGEVGKVQFKERLLDKYDIGCELVAFSNARGGMLIVGVKDKTERDWLVMHSMRLLLIRCAQLSPMDTTVRNCCVIYDSFGLTGKSQWLLCCCLENTLSAGFP